MTKGKPPLGDRVYNKLLKVFGPAQITPLTEAERGVASLSPVRTGSEWVLRRGSDGRSYLTASGSEPHGEAPEAGHQNP